MRILFASMEYPPETGWGGIGSYVADVAPALASRGHEVHVLSCVPEQDERDYVDRGVYIHRRGRMAAPTLYAALGYRPTRVLLGLLTRLSLALRYWTSEHLLQCASVYVEYQRLGMAFDVIEAPEWMAEGLLLSLFSRSPVVAHLHTPLHVLWQYGGIPLHRRDWCADWLERLAVERADVVTSPSRLLVGLLERNGWLRHGRVRVIPLPIDGGRWQGIAPVEATDRLVLQVGRIEARKGPDTLIRALGLLKHIPGVRAVFAGRPVNPYAAEIEGLAVREGVDCIFAGYVPRAELAEQLARARVVVLHSTFDNFPMAVLEAMAAGRPVVVSDGVGMKDLLIESGAGVVTPRADANALADALAPFLTDPQHAGRVGRKGRALVEHRFKPQRIARERERVYREAIEVSQGRGAQPAVAAASARCISTD